MMLIAVRRLCGHSDTAPKAGPTHCVERISAPISPPPDKQSSGDGRVATFGVSSERSGQVLIRLRTTKLHQTRGPVKVVSAGLQITHARLRPPSRALPAPAHASVLRRPF